MGQSPNIKITMQIARQITPRNILFLAFNIVALITFYAPMRDLIALSLHSETYSHIILIPLISGYFMYLKRKAIFSDTNYDYTAGIILVLVGSILYLISKKQGINLDQNDYLSLTIFSMGVILSNVFLQTGWRRIILILSIFPIAIIKNGIRIVTLSSLALYVDQSFLTNSMLHREGGIIFFLIALLLLLAILWLLRKSERRIKNG